MTANDYQVGGSHYKNAQSFEHWDWVVAIGMGPEYLMGNATKYVARWRKKDGFKDLKKALHYVNKLIEISPEIRDEYYSLTPALRVAGSETLRRELHKFAAANALGPQETDFCGALVNWRIKGDLVHARYLLLALMEQASKEAPPVPLEDSNKHGERA